MIALLILAVSIPITLFSVVFTVYFYRKGYKSSRNMQEPFNRAIVLTFFSLPFNLVMAFYLTGVMIFFMNDFDSNMDLSTLFQGLVISLFVGTIHVLGPFLSIFDSHDTHTILSMFNFTSTLMKTFINYVIIIIITCLVWYYKFRRLSKR